MQPAFCPHCRRPYYRPYYRPYNRPYNHTYRNNPYTKPYYRQYNNSLGYRTQYTRRPFNVTNVNSFHRYTYAPRISTTYFPHTTTPDHPTFRPYGRTHVSSFNRAHGYQAQNKRPTDRSYYRKPPNTPKASSLKHSTYFPRDSTTDHTHAHTSDPLNDHPSGDITDRPYIITPSYRTYNKPTDHPLYNKANDIPRVSSLELSTYSPYDSPTGHAHDYTSDHPNVRLRSRDRPSEDEFSDHAYKPSTYSSITDRPPPKSSNDVQLECSNDRSAAASSVHPYTLTPFYHSNRSPADRPHYNKPSDIPKASSSKSSTYPPHDPSDQPHLHSTDRSNDRSFGASTDRPYIITPFHRSYNSPANDPSDQPYDVSTHSLYDPPSSNHRHIGQGNVSTTTFIFATQF